MTIDLKSFFKKGYIKIEKFGRFKILQAQYDQLTADQKHRCCYLDIV